MHTSANRKRHAFAAAALLLGTLSVPAMAKDRAAAGEPARNTANSQANASNERVCVQMEEGVGSRVRSKICKTRAEWIREEGAVPGKE